MQYEPQHLTFFVGSSNPAKIQAVHQVVTTAWPQAVVEGLEVESGVSSQPRSDEETRQGARQRALRALELGQKQLHSSEEATILGVGVEGGVFSVSDELWSTAWIVIVDTQHRFYEANGARFRLPSSIAERIQNGEEMGPVMIEMVGRSDVPKKEGMIGVVTGGFVTRPEEYGSIAKLAIGLWYGAQSL